MKILYLGDPHVQHTNIEESDRLLQFTIEQARKYLVDRIVILGDIFHNHALVRVEVLEFWDKWIDALSREFQLIVLKGNHDMVGNYESKSHAISVFASKYTKSVTIVSDPVLIGIFGYMPYFHDKDAFIMEANKLHNQGAKIIICHQAFEGSRYENGMYAPDGVDPSKLLCGLIISGHIHCRQIFDKIIHPGTARWLTSSDANEEKGLWLVEHHDATGEILKEMFIDTSTVCIPIVKFTWKEGQEMPKLSTNSKTTIELVGSSDWIFKQKQHLKGLCSISTKITDTKKARWTPKKSENNLENFIMQQFQISTGLSKEKLLSYMKEESIIV